ncbi:MAG: thiamine pyrophosphate-dependent enzyme [Patescibacteria group bacterium]|nr:2-oxoacid ferredoxin oxidoreductase [Patescibacteria group bacterium]
MTHNPFKSPIAPTWCPGCGDFVILRSLQTALVDSGFKPAETVLCYGIGCSGNMADFNLSYGFHGLHGRSLANAIGIKLANHHLQVAVIVGDGDGYGEGLNHLIALARGNHDVTVIVHNNSRYSLTTGQSSPTTIKGTKTKSTPQGVLEQAFNPIATCLATEATFVARAYTGQPAQLTKIIQAGFEHKGFALIDVIQYCPTFNQKQDHAWFSERVYDLKEAGHDAGDKLKAMQLAQEKDRIPLGIFYQDLSSPPYHAQVSRLDKKTLIDQSSTKVNLTQAMVNFD